MDGYVEELNPGVDIFLKKFILFFYIFLDNYNVIYTSWNLQTTNKHTTDFWTPSIQLI